LYGYEAYIENVREQGGEEKFRLKKDGMTGGYKKLYILNKETHNLYYSSPNAVLHSIMKRRKKRCSTLQVN
jgi:hypothetical protein